MSEPEKCTCPPCTMCRGTGRLVYDTGCAWNDDPSFDEVCDECGGSGIEVECDYCHDRRDVDDAWIQEAEDV